MTLRRRMILSSSMQLLAVGALLAIAYAGFHRTVLPSLMEHLRTKTAGAANTLRIELDVPLAADDRDAMAGAIERLRRDPDLAYVAVLDATGAEVVRHGVAAGGGLAASSEISLEGVPLGKVEVRYSTARVDRLETWARRFAAIAVLVWLAAFAHALRFARAFVAPIRRMMDFSGQVAGGRFTEQLDGAAPGELGELKEHLNRMARDLDSREQERQRAEARAEQMRQELLTVSRMAGMAEVATGVLHNVGNVLNSLNTSVSLMQDRVRNTKVKALARSIALYRDHPGGLAAFLGTEKGQLLPRYLEKVVDQLGAENTAVLEELASVGRHVQHIATIVTTQQAYTRVAPIREETDLARLIDDALGMVEGSFSRHGVELVKDYQAVAPVVTDRHKVLQILVNLIGNARHALKDRPGPRLVVSMVPVDGGVAIRVEDNGVGIPAENLDKVFQHGFTTKKDGHGFGLHSAANAAGELEGTLTVSSEGAGHGARFTLTLPYPPGKVSNALAS